MRPTKPGDTVALGFTPLFAVMTGAQITTDALTSIFTFSTALRAANPGSLAAIDDLLDRRGHLRHRRRSAPAKRNDGGDRQRAAGLQDDRR